MESLNTLLQKRASLTPDKELYIFLEDGARESGRLSYSGLDQAARRVAAGLGSHFARGERLLLLHPPGQSFVEAFFGCLYAGNVAVPAFPPLQPEHIERLFAIADDAAVSGVLTTEGLLQLVQTQIGRMSGSQPLRCLATDTLPAAEATPFAPAADDLAYLQYTSGSTGAPKGVMISHGNLMANERVIQSAFGHSADTVGCGWLPVYHDMGLVGKVIQPLVCGGSVVLMPPFSFLRRPLRWLHAISRYRATTAGAPNFAYDLCVRRFRPDAVEGLELSSWEVAFCGAEPVRAATLHRFAQTFAAYGFRAEAFYPCYGLAESTLMVAGPQKLTPTTLLSVDRQRLEDDRIAAPPHGCTRTSELVGCGHAWQETKILVVDPETLRLCPADVIGEVWAAGDSVAQGYWNNPAATAQTFRAYTAEGDGPFLRTGDLGFFHDGELFISGRLKDLLIIRGRNYFPQDIEGVLEDCHPALRPGKIAAFSVDEEGEERLVIAAEVNRRAVAGLDAAAVAVAIQAAVGREFQLPLSALVLLTAGGLPQTTSGKVRRSTCRALYQSGQLDCVAQWRGSKPNLQTKG